MPSDALSWIPRRRLDAHDDERLQRVEAVVAVLDRRVTALSRELRARAPEVGAASADATASVLPAQALAPSGPAAVAAAAGPSATREPVGDADQALLVAVKAAPAVAAVASAPLASAATTAAEGAERADAAPANAAGAALGAGVPTPEAQSSLEERIGLVWFNRIGAAVLLLGVAYFFKYAVDNAWIGPMGRVAVGAFVGSAPIALAEWLRPRTRPVFIHALVGVGLAILLFSAYAAFGFYQLLPLPMAFAVLALGALAAFLLQWLLAWWVARRRELDRLAPLALLSFSAVTVHAAASALLYDHPELLGGGFVALAALFGWLLRREGRLDLLVVPLLASFPAGRDATGRNGSLRRVGLRRHGPGPQLAVAAPAARRARRCDRSGQPRARGHLAAP